MQWRKSVAITPISSDRVIIILEVLLTVCF